VIEKLETLSDDDLIHAVVEYVVLQLGKDPNRQAAAVNDLSPGLRAFYATWLVDAEVKNGGFNQYFWNNGGGMAAAAVEGFRLLGTQDHAALMLKAVAIWEQEREGLEHLEAEGTLEAFSEADESTALGELDAPYYDLADIEAVHIQFIRAHPEMFDDRARRVN
jgi:uncharacterized protein DUF4375